MLRRGGLGLRDMLLLPLRRPLRWYEGERDRRGDIDRLGDRDGERDFAERGVMERVRSRPRDGERGMVV